MLSYSKKQLNRFKSSNKTIKKTNRNFICYARILLEEKQI